MSDHPSRRERWLVLLALVAIVGVTIALAISTIVLLLPRPTFTVHEPMKVHTPVVKSGGWVVIDLLYSKPTSADALVGFNLSAEGILYSTPAMLMALPRGDHQIKVPVRVPEGLPPGRYVCYLVKRRITDVYFPWPLLGQNEPLLAVSEPFEVTQ